MLIHVSKFQKVQQKVQNQIINYLDDLRKNFIEKKHNQINCIIEKNSINNNI